MLPQKSARLCTLTPSFSDPQFADHEFAEPASVEAGGTAVFGGFAGTGSSYRKRNAFRFGPASLESRRKEEDVKNAIFMCAKRRSGKSLLDVCHRLIASQLSRCGSGPNVKTLHFPILGENRETGRQASDNHDSPTIAIFEVNVH